MLKKRKVGSAQHPVDASVIGASGSVVGAVCKVLGACGARTQSIGSASRSKKGQHRGEDEEEEEEDNDDAVVIAQSRFVLVCVTRELFNRVDGKAEKDACGRAFREAWLRKGRYMVPMVMGARAARSSCVASRAGEDRAGARPGL